MTTQFLLSLLSGIAIGGVAGFLGSLMLQKRMSLVAGPLGHLAFPGVALALLYGFDISLGAFPFIIAGIIIIWALELKTKLPTEALTAIVFAVGVSIALIFLPVEKAENALVGEISQINLSGALIAIGLSLLVFVIVYKIFSKLILISVSEDLAKVEGVNIKLYNFIYLLAVAIIVALGVKLVGVLLTAALVALPATTARNLANSMKSYVGLSIIFGVLAPTLGLLTSLFVNFPAGTLIIIFGTIMFLVSVFAKRSYARQ